MKQFYAGLDLGGTHMAAGIIDADGHLLSRAERPTLSGRPTPEILQDMAACVTDALSRAGLDMGRVASLGIGFPGNADLAKGLAFGCNNLGWTELPLVAEMSSRIPLPVFIANDADCAALAESRFGAAAGADSCILLTLGTGMGGGIILHKKIWTGAHGIGGEIGHMTLYPGGLPCNCGRRGCAERYCSATALIEGVRRNASAFPSSPLAQSFGPALNARVIIDAAREGDPLAGFVFEDFVRALATVVDSLLFALDPEVILLGGGVSRAGSFLLDALLAKLPREAMGVSRSLPRFALAALGNDAGIIGAALLGA